jgi:formylglycine-generating enzyme required for sulfatase activity
MDETMPDLSNPFPGLRCFQTDEDFLFFGRHEQVEDLLRRLRTNRLVAVVGTSGSGKSSLVRAGLLPAVLGGGMAQAGSSWEIAVMRPGGSPLAHLARALCDAGLYDADAEDALFHLQATLSRSRNGLVEAVRQSRPSRSGLQESGSKLLLVVDQFEELFRFHRAGATSQEEAIGFVNLLLHATERADQNVYVVLTMRSDFLGECSQFLGLAEAVNDGEFLIPRMTRDQVQEAIEGPIRVRGAAIAPRLLFRLLNDVQDSQDQLPVLQHALMRTWDLWLRSRPSDGPVLDLAHYEATGGMHEALSQHADEVFADLPSERHRASAARIFKALTERGPDGRGIRRPTRLGQLEAIAAVEEPTVHQVIEAYRVPGVTFLMPPMTTTLDEGTVVDISHESLMRVWRRLREWVEEEAQSARIYRRLHETAVLHAENRAGLYHDPDLQIARTWRETSGPNAAWADQYGGGIVDAMAFLDASREAAERTQQDRETARRIELERARQLAEAQAGVARLFKRFAGGLAVGVCLTVALAAWAFTLRQAAARQAQEAKRLEDVADTQRRRAEDNQKKAKALGLMQRLVNVSTPKVPEIIGEMAEYRRWTDPLLRNELDKSEERSSQKLHASLALLSADPGQVDYLYGRLLGADLDELRVIRDALAPYKARLLDKLWAVAEKPRQGDESQRLRAAAALAKYDPNDRQWANVQGAVVSDLLATPIAQLEILAGYAADQPLLLANLLLEADDQQFAVIFPKLQEHREREVPILTSEVDIDLAIPAPQAKRQANAAVALLRLNHPEKVWPLLKRSSNPSVCSNLIHRLNTLGADAEKIAAQLEKEPDPSIRGALLLSLGEFGENELTPDKRQALLPKLQGTYLTAADPALHASAEWLLRQWKEDEWLAETNTSWADGEQQRSARLEEIEREVTQETGNPQARWFVNGQGQTLVVIPGPVEFWMGSPPTEEGRDGGPAGTDELRHWRRIGRSFAIASKEVTVEQFLRFREDHPFLQQFASSNDCPVNNVTWYDAAAYCNWLSAQEGIPPDQWCYEPNSEGKFAGGMKMAANYLKRTGYRLPTEAEWEYSCRAGAVTRYYFGDSEELLPKYVWWKNNSQSKSLPVGILKPNDLGLFDMLGNNWEWCQNLYEPYGAGADGKAVEDLEEIVDITNRDSLVLRGGDFNGSTSLVRSAERSGHVPADQYVYDWSFRPARSLSLSSHDHYAAARAAALAAAGQGNDPPLDDAAKAKLRRQAVGLLQSELAAWSKLKPPHAFIARNVWTWQHDIALAGIRDPEALSKLPAEELTVLTQFWTNVAASAQPADGAERLEFARVAVLMAAGEGNDEASLDDEVRAKLRAQAFAWLKTELMVASDRAGKAKIIAVASLVEGVLAELAESAPNDGRFQAELARHLAERGQKAQAEVALAKARALFETQLASEPASATIASDLADVLLFDTRWTVLRLFEMKAGGGATLAKLADESVLVGGVNPANPQQDVDTLTFRDLPGRIQQLRLEVLTHESLPNHGPGRNPIGQFVLSTIKAQLDVPETEVEGRNLKLAKAWADNATGIDSVIGYAIDENDGTGWRTESSKPHFAVFALAEEGVTETVGAALRVSLECKWGPQHGLGRFRLSASGEPAAFDWEEKRLVSLTATSPHAKLGAAYLAVDDARRAADVLERATAANPNLPVADWLFLALAYARLKETAQAASACGGAAQRMAPTGADVALRPLLREVLIALGPSSSEAAALLAASAGPPTEALNAAIERNPNASAYLSRADWFINHGVWKKACEDLAAAFRLEPDVYTGLRLGILLVQTGQVNRYRVHCRAMLERWAATEKNNEADQTLKTIVLLPDYEADAQELARLAEVAASGDAKADWFEWYMVAKGLYDYRAGKYAEALTTCRESRIRAVGGKGDPQALTSTNLAIEAMAQFHSGDEAGAQRALAEAKSTVEKYVPGIDASGWPHDWLVAHMLYQESEGLIAGKTVEQVEESRE